MRLDSILRRDLAALHLREIGLLLLNLLLVLLFLLRLIVSVNKILTPLVIFIDVIISSLKQPPLLLSEFLLSLPIELVNLRSPTLAAPTQLLRDLLLHL